MLILVQPLARISDRVGRGPNIAVGLGAVAAGLLVVLAAGDLLTLILGGAIRSAGAGLVEPACTALALDMAPPHRRGAAMAMYTAAFQVGNAVGALTWGFVIAAAGFEVALAGAVGATLLALVILRLSWSRVQVAASARAG